MSVRDWLMQGSPKILGAALATSVAAGLGVGAWLQLPAYLSQPITRTEPQMIQLEDPGRAQWRQVVASLGGLGATFVVPSFIRGEPQPAVLQTENDREFDRVMAEAEDMMRAADAREAEREGYRRQEADWRLRRVDDRIYGYETAADPYGYGPPPAYRPPRGYGERPRYEDLARYEPALDETRTVEPEEAAPIPPPPPRPAGEWFP